MVTDIKKHYPVLLEELISVITLNMVAHLLTALLVRWLFKRNFKYKNTKVIAFDRDIKSKKS